MHPLLRDLYSCEELAVMWLGNNSWLIHQNGVLLASDIDLASDYRIHPSPLSARDIAPHLDVHFITHGHSDHLNEGMNRIFMEQGSCSFVLPENCEEIAHSLGIDRERLKITRPGEEFTIFGVHVQTLLAIHGDKDFAIAESANFSDCGYVFEINGLHLLQPGDTVLTTQHLKLENIDVLFVSPTEHNMHIQQSAILIDRLKPDYIFPQHYGTNIVSESSAFWSLGFQDELFEMLPALQKGSFKKLDIGDIFEIK